MIAGTERSRCAVCEADGLGPLYEASERMLGTGETFTYWGCPSCGCLQLVDAPLDMSPYYSAGYYSFAMPTVFGRWVRRWWLRGVLEGRSIVGSALRRAFGDPSWLTWVRRAGTPVTGRVLDVGSGGGRRLADMANAGFTDVLGVDPYAEAVDGLPRGARLIRSDLRDLGGVFNLIMFNHSLEHMEDQIGALRSAERLLADDGVVLVRVPVQGLAWDIFGERWVQLDPPRHLFIHTEASLGIAAAAAGLRVVDTVYDSSEFQFWGSELYERDTPLAGRPWHRREIAARILRFRNRGRRAEARVLNEDRLGDQAAFYLRR